MQQKTKLTVRVDASALEEAKRYVTTHSTSLSALISTFLHTLAEQDPQQAQTPILHKLTGILPQENSKEEYHAYLDQKYGS